MVLNECLVAFRVHEVRNLTELRRGRRRARRAKRVHPTLGRELHPRHASAARQTGLCHTVPKPHNAQAYLCGMVSTKKPKRSMRQVCGRCRARHQPRRGLGLESLHQRQKQRSTKRDGHRGKHKPRFSVKIACSVTPTKYYNSALLHRTWDIFPAEANNLKGLQTSRTGRNNAPYRYPHFALDSIGGC